MARFDRCNICDYSEQNGSSLAGVNPGANGRVRRFGDDLLCDTCSLSIDRARVDLREPKEVDEDLVLLED